MTGWREYLNTIAQKLESEYQMSDNIEHAQTMGIEREIFLNNVLSELYPNKYVFTSGEIIDADGKNSKQCDIIIYDERYPQIKYGRAAQLFAEGVLAHIEVKSKLQGGSGELVKAYQTCDSILKMNQYSSTIAGDTPSPTKSDMESVEKISTSIFSYTGYQRSPFENTVDWCLEDDVSTSDNRIQIGTVGERMEIPEKLTKYKLPNYICVLDDYFIDISHDEERSEYLIDFYTDSPFARYINSIANSLSDYRSDEMFIDHYVNP